MRVLPSGGIVCAHYQGRSRGSEAPLVSLVIPMFNESEGLFKLFTTIRSVMDSHMLEYEIVCIDDGSRDATFELLKSCAQTDPHIRAFRLSRNFGKEVALSAGLDLAEGDVVIPMDADLQEPPELINEMLSKWQEGYDMVFAVRRSRNRDGFLKSRSAGLFYKLFNSISESKIPENSGDFRLMDRCVVDVLKQLPERNRFMKGLLTWPGFRTTQIFFDRPERFAGHSKWKPHKLIGLAMDGLTSFSIVPLRLASFLGAGISLFAFLFGFFVIAKQLLFGDPVQGYTSMMTMVVFLGGVQLLALGVLGEYIGRIYLESKRRPLYVIAEIADERNILLRSHGEQGDHA